MTTIERLKLGRERIARGWTQGHYAVDSAGCTLHYADPLAVAWCPLGALLGGCAEDIEARLLLRNTIGEHVPTWNDRPNRTQADVLKAFDDTIARLEAAAT